MPCEVAWGLLSSMYWDAYDMMGLSEEFKVLWVWGFIGLCKEFEVLWGWELSNFTCLCVRSIQSIYAHKTLLHGTSYNMTDRWWEKTNPVFTVISECATPAWTIAAASIFIWSIFTLFAALHSSVLICDGLRVYDAGSKPFSQIVGHPIFAVSFSSNNCLYLYNILLIITHLLVSQNMKYPPQTTTRWYSLEKMYTGVKRNGKLRSQSHNRSQKLQIQVTLSLAKS